MRTLSIDIGGTGIKALLQDEGGAPITDRARVLTPRPAVPENVLRVVEELGAKLGDFDRVSVGFPGVVHEGVTKTAPNLDAGWAGFPVAAMLEARTGKPVRVLNDCAVQGLAVIAGKGFEVMITLGTGLGCCLYLDGRPGHLELAHHPYKNRLTYEDLVGNPARKAAGNRRWSRRVLRAIAQMEALFNYDRLYVGGGNAKHLEREGLPANVSVVDNMGGLLGGIHLWR